MSDYKLELQSVFALQDLTNRARDSLVSFGERLSTRLFAAYLRHQVADSLTVQGSGER